MAVKDRVKVADIIVDRLLKDIEENKRLPWDRGFTPGCINWFSKREYKGINRFLLYGGSGEYLTFKQLCQYNKKNDTNFRYDKDKKYTVVFFSQSLKECEKPEKESSWIIKKGDKYFRKSYILRYYYVFDIMDCKNEAGEHLPSRIGKDVIPVFEDAEQIVKSYLTREKVSLVETGSCNVPCFTRIMDVINMPLRNQFNTAEVYYRVLFHEMVHSTGTESRLNRKCYVLYHEGKKERSKEECVAEFGSLLLASECNFKEDYCEDNSEAYLLSWVKWIQENKSEVLSAMTYAQLAVDYILGDSNVDDGIDTTLDKDIS